MVPELQLAALGFDQIVVRKQWGAKLLGSVDLVVRKNHQGVGPSINLFEGEQLELRSFHEWVVAADLVSLGEKGCDLQGGGFSSIVDVRFVTHSQQSEFPYGWTNLPLNSLDGVLWHLVVQFARRSNDVETIDALGQEPRIDGDAVAP